MTFQYADATTPRSSSPLLSWLLPSAAMIAAVVGFAFVAAGFGLSRPADGGAAVAPEIPATGSNTGASRGTGERPVAPASGVPDFAPWQERHWLVGDASAG